MKKPCDVKPAIVRFAFARRGSNEFCFFRLCCRRNESKSRSVNAQAIGHFKLRHSS
jgi:hypothetical protein